MTIDTSLDTLMLPALPTYQNEFGSKKLNGGLTTAECADGVMIWGRRQRPFPVTETSVTTKVEANCTFEVTTAGIELTIADATFAGCEAKVINASDGTITVKGGVSGLNGSSDAVTIPPRAMLFLTFFEGWITSNSTYSGNNEVSDFEKRIFLAAHPVTTLYWTSDNRNPGDVYGGTWKQIKDRFVLAAGDTYTNGAIGGNADTTLTIENLPSHTHGLNNHTHYYSGETGSNGAHGHSIWSGYGAGDWVGMASAYGICGSKGNDGYYSTFPSTGTGIISSVGNHSHSFSGTTKGASGDTTATGSGTAFSNMPPYVGKYCWERVA